MSADDPRTIHQIIRDLLTLDLQESIDRGEWPPQYGWRRDRVWEILMAPRPPWWRRLLRRIRAR